MSDNTKREILKEMMQGNAPQMVRILSQKDGQLFDNAGRTINENQVEALNRNSVVIIKTYE